MEGFFNYCHFLVESSIRIKGLDLVFCLMKRESEKGLRISLMGSERLIRVKMNQISRKVTKPQKPVKEPKIKKDKKTNIK